MRAAEGASDHELLGLEDDRDGRRPFKTRGRPEPSLNKERTSSERGSPGITQPRRVRSVAILPEDKGG